MSVMSREVMPSSIPKKNLREFYSYSSLEDNQSTLPLGAVVHFRSNLISISGGLKAVCTET